MPDWEGAYLFGVEPVHPVGAIEPFMCLTREGAYLFGVEPPLRAHGDPNGIRTRVCRMKTYYPRPLDDGVILRTGT